LTNIHGRRSKPCSRFAANYESLTDVRESPDRFRRMVEVRTTVTEFLILVSVKSCVSLWRQALVAAYGQPSSPTNDGDCFVASLLAMTMAE
jgi:hypothetical protein